MAVVLFDHRIDVYWPEIEAECEVLMQQSSALRKCWSSTFPGAPDDAHDRLDTLLRPGEDIGQEKP